MIYKIKIQYRLTKDEKDVSEVERLCWLRYKNIITCNLQHNV